MKNADKPAIPPGGTNIHTGLTKLESLMAHAPAEPQSWFEPVMPPKPVAPNKMKELNSEQREKFGVWLDIGDEEYLSTDPVLTDFINRFEAWSRANSDWRGERRKQLYTQWPAAWANAVLTGLEKQK